MNLRWVHAVLIMLSAILAVVFGIWSLDVYARGHNTGSLVAAIVAFAVSVGLVVYDSWFLRKTRMLR
jgi:hypothetical protein